MKRLTLLILLIACAMAARLQGQIAAKSPEASPVAPAKKAKKPATKKENTSSAAKLFGQPAIGSQSNTPTQVNNTYLTRLGLWSVMAGGGGAENFTRIGHSLLVLVAGCVGGWVSGLIDRRHREDRSRLPAR